MEVKTVYCVHWGDLENFVHEVYGRSPKIALMEECGNDTTLSFEIDGNYDSYDAKRFDEFKTTGYVSYGTRMLLNKLAKEGHIPTGTYNIEVSW